MNCDCDIITLLLLLCCCNKGPRNCGGCGGGCGGGCHMGCGCDCCDIIWLMALLNCFCGNKCCK